MPCQNCRCPSCLALVDSDFPITSTEFPPPPSELMTTNRAPTDSEVAHSREVIHTAGNMISLIQKTIKRLKKKKAELSSLIDTHKAAISPLRSFPPELLARIFAELVTIAGSYWTPRNCPPLALMRICSRWRGIVLGTPQLWTKILGAPTMIDTWIVRSKELPLYLELDFDSPDSYPVLEALIPHSYRWEYVNFSLEPDSLAVLARVRTRLHSLKRLNLFFGGVTGTVDFCEVAPRLTEIKLAGNYEPAVIKLPWEQLRVCTVDNSGVALYVLQHAKDLQTFHLDMNGGSDFDAPWLPMPRGPHAHHPGLETLIIEGTPDMAFFFSSITLPSLQTLEVSFGDIDSDDDSDEEDAKDRSELVPIISTFLERSSKHLTTLILTNIPFPPNGLIKCLAIVPSLVSLDIQFDHQDVINDKFLHALNVNFPGYILPRLRSLSLRGPGMFSEERLDAVVTSRRDIRPTNDEIALLENLTLECSIPLGQSTRRLPRIHRFVCGGLNITYGAGWSIYNSIQTDRSESDLGERA